MSGTRLSCQSSPAAAGRLPQYFGFLAGYVSRDEARPVGRASSGPPDTNNRDAKGAEYDRPCGAYTAADVLSATKASEASDDARKMFLCAA